MKVSGNGRPTDASSRAGTVKTILLREARLTMPMNELSDDEDLMDGMLNLTSLGVMGVLVAIEGELQMKFRDEIFAETRLDRVGDLLRLVEQEIAHDRQRPGVTGSDRE